MKNLLQKVIILGIISFILLFNNILKAQQNILLTESDMPGWTLEKKSHASWYINDSVGYGGISQRWLIKNDCTLYIEYIECDNVTNAIQAITSHSNTFAMPFNIGFNKGIIYSDNSWIYIAKNSVYFQRKNYAIKLNLFADFNYDIIDYPILYEVAELISEKIERNIDHEIIEKEQELLKHCISEAQYNSIVKNAESILLSNDYTLQNTSTTGWVPQADSLILGHRKLWSNDSSTFSIDIAQYVDASAAAKAVNNYWQLTLNHIPICDFSSAECMDTLIPYLMETKYCLGWLPSFSSVSLVGNYNNYSVLLYYHNYAGFDTVFYKSIIESLDFETIATNKLDLSNYVFNIYPNPTTGFITIRSSSFKEDNYSLRIYNTIGKEVYSRKVSFQKYLNLNLSYLSKGLYFIEIENNRTKHCKKIVLQ